MVCQIQKFTRVTEIHCEILFFNWKLNHHLLFIDYVAGQFLSLIALPNLTDRLNSLMEPLLLLVSLVVRALISYFWYPRYSGTRILGSAAHHMSVVDFVTLHLAFRSSHDFACGKARWKLLKSKAFTMTWPIIFPIICPFPPAFLRSMQSWVFYQTMLGYSSKVLSLLQVLWVADKPQLYLLFHQARGAECAVLKWRGRRGYQGNYFVLFLNITEHFSDPLFFILANLLLFLWNKASMPSCSSCSFLQGKYHSAFKWKP